MGKDNKSRNASFEMLRIIAAMGVIILHYNSFANETIVEKSLSQFYILFTNCVFSCSVDVFVIISSFFLCCSNKRKLSKIFELSIQFILFRVGYYALLAIVDKVNFDLNTIIYLFLPINYYIILYSVLYVISPYINVLIDGLSERAFNRLVVLLVCLFSLETWFVDMLDCVSNKTFDGLSTVGLLGSQNGFTIVNFVVLYFIGACIRRNAEKIIKVKMAKIVGLLFLLLSVMYIFVLFGNNKGLELAILNYNSPFVIGFAVLIVMIFMKLHIESKIINEFAQSVFTCFIVHGSVLPFFKIEQAVQLPIVLLFIHQIVVITGIFLIAYIIYKVYNCFSRPVFMWIYKQLPGVDFYIDMS